MVNCLLYQTFEYEFEFRTSKYLYFDMSLDFPLPLEFCPPPPPEELKGGQKNFWALCALFVPPPELNPVSAPG